MIFIEAEGRGKHHFFLVDKSLCLPKLKLITVLLHDILVKNDKKSRKCGKYQESIRSRTIPDPG